ncbi:hypothetical protein Gogos_006005 [Gossypium gossypioides]|uniref:RNase H type-1 domain-containing protein n=1 Tax=Gossypium gossypioides TaxID=34282 RepID=A0A7J9C4A8_GOSGO|nr:hypothetical protein [Gossypium gossypioides]
MFRWYKVRDFTKNPFSKTYGGFKNSNKEMSGDFHSKSAIGAIIRDIQNKKSDFQELIFLYIHRSENSYAHRLAKNALEKGETTYLRGEELDSHAFASVGIWSRNPN